MNIAKSRAVTQHEIFGPYEVYERLGVGGMATVHRARERGIEGFERVVALKRLLPHLAEDETFVRSFVREAKLASMLQHANIVQLYELGRVGAVYFISMEYIEGRDVRRILRQSCRVTGPPPLPVFLAILSQLCDALEYAHTRADEHGEPLGLVHRDVSPSNLLITRSGHLKIIDFGIAKAQTRQLSTNSGSVKGKLAYMAPEAIRGQELDARSDIFAVGVIAHELLTAQPLFATQNDYQTILRVQHSAIAPPSAQNPECPPELDEIVLTALARDPGERWQSAAELRGALHRLSVRYQVSATSTELAAWMKWAFAAERSEHGQPGGTGEPISQVSASISPSYSRSPAQAFARPGSGRPAPQAPRPEAEEPFLNAKTRPVPAASAPTGPGKDDRVLVHAWGEPGPDASAAVLLEDVPDVSETSGSARALRPVTRQRRARSRLSSDLQSPAGQAGDMQPPGSGTNLRPEDERADTTMSMAAEFGASIVAKGEAHRRRAVIGMITTVVALAGLGYVLIKNRAPSPVATPQIGTATLRLLVEPSDATMDIMGYGKHRGSPRELQVEAPATYRVEVTHPDFLPYVTDIEVEPGVKNVVRMALIREPGDAGKAQVTVETTPVAKEPEEEPTAPELPLSHIAADSSASPPRAGKAVLAGKAQRRRADAGVAHSSPGLPEIKSASPLASLRLNELTVPQSAPPPTPAGPALLPPGAVKKRSGKIPVLPGTEYDTPGQVSTKLCIDTRGKVTSVEVVSDMSARARYMLMDAMKGWRYAPYKKHGVAMPACFAVSFKIDIRR